MSEGLSGLIIERRDDEISELRQYISALKEEVNAMCFKLGIPEKYPPQIG